MFHPNHQFLNRTATQACRVGGVHLAKTLHIYAPLPPLCAFKRRVLPQRTPRLSSLLPDPLAPASTLPSGGRSREIDQP